MASNLRYAVFEFEEADFFRVWYEQSVVLKTSCTLFRYIVPLKTAPCSERKLKNPVVLLGLPDAVILDPRREWVGGGGGTEYVRSIPQG
jgi:hypothetical protein